MKNIFFLVFMALTLSHCQASDKDSSVLTYLVRPPKGEMKNPPLILLLHGIGSNEADLFSFANQLPDSFLVVSARATFPIAKGSYKWYDMNFVEGKPVINAEQAETSRKTILQFIHQLKNKHDFDEKSVYLCGFSQGAIMSLSVALTEPKEVKGVIALSGRVLSEIKPLIASKEDFSNLKVLVIHGKADNVLPVFHAQETKSLLDILEIQNEYHELNMGHTVTNETLAILNHWLTHTK